MTLSLRSLGSGQVNFSADRPVLHFGTPPEVVAQVEKLDRIRKSGFLIDLPKDETP